MSFLFMLLFLRFLPLILLILAALWVWNWLKTRSAKKRQPPPDSGNKDGAYIEVHDFEVHEKHDEE